MSLRAAARQSPRNVGHAWEEEIAASRSTRALLAMTLLILLWIDNFIEDVKAKVTCIDRIWVAEIKDEVAGL
jgi:hypothetical protein